MEWEKMGRIKSNKQTSYFVEVRDDEERCWGIV